LFSGLRGFVLGQVQYSSEAMAQAHSAELFADQRVWVDYLRAHGKNKRQVDENQLNFFNVWIIKICQIFFTENTGKNSRNA
jgi:hypothetical protein